MQKYINNTVRNDGNALAELLKNEIIPDSLKHFSNYGFIAKTPDGKNQLVIKTRPIGDHNENITIENIEVNNTAITTAPAFMMEKDGKWYTLDEVIEQMRPQAEKDKVLITDCINGLGLYAVQQVMDDASSPKVSEIRDLIHNLACYWGFEESEVKPEDFLNNFDKRIKAAKSGAAVTSEEIIKSSASTVYGLYRFGEDMIVSMGTDAVDYIQLAIDFMIEIAADWDFESDLLDGMIANLKTEVQAMRDELTVEQSANDETQPGQNGGISMS